MGVSVAARWRRLLKKIPIPVGRRSLAARRRRRATETGYPGARAGSAAETRKVEITESSASSSMQGWRINPGSDLEFALGQRRLLISRLKEKLHIVES